MSERPRPPVENERNTEPIEIRGHHLPLYRYATRGVNLTKLAKDIKIDYLFRVGSPIGMRSAGAYDTIGSTEEEANRYQINLEQTLQEFVDSPSQRKIELIEGRKDDICNRCPIIGKHCTSKEQTRFGGITPIIDVDIHCTDVFLRKAQELNIEASIENDIAKFTDAPTINVKRIKTNVGTVRTILQNSSFSDWNWHD